MKFETIYIQANQSLFDIAMQYYGHVDHVVKLIQDNPSLNLVSVPASGATVKIDRDFIVQNQTAQKFYIKENVKVATYTISPEDMPPPPFEFTDVDAEAYYDALVVANGDLDLDASIYFLSLDELKITIEDTILALKLADIWNLITRLYLFIGGSAATHAINAKTGASELIYFNSPTHSAEGMILNGVNQYASMNNNPISDTAVFSSHIGIKAKITNEILSMGSRHSASNTTFLRASVSGVSCSLNGYFMGDGLSDYNLYHLATRTSNNYAAVYIDGLLNDFTEGVAVATASNLPIFIGSWNNYGAPLAYSQGQIKTAHIGVGLGAGKSFQLATIINSFNTSINR
jgi:hypothetical protein